MALEPEVKQTVRWITEAFDQFASEQGWRREDYRVLVRVNQDWGRVHVILAAKQFPGNTPQEQWMRVMEYLTDKLNQDNPGLIRSVSLTLRTFEQIEVGGIYTIGSQFVDVRDVLVGEYAG